MLRLLMTEFEEALAEYREKEANNTEKKAGHRATFISGKLAAPFIRDLAGKFMEAFPQYDIQVVDIRNDFFGERITVSGPITGQDLIAQTRDLNLGEYIGIPCNMLRMGENVFLDDITVEEAEKTLQAPIHIVKSSGQDLLNAMLGIAE